MNASGGKIWFTAAEIAELGLPGLPRSKRKVNERAADEGWALKTNASGMALARPRKVRGGGLEYHVDLLPAAARVALVGRSDTDKAADQSARCGTAAPANDSGPSSSVSIEIARRWSWYEAQSDTTKETAARRARVIAAVDAYESSGMKRSAAVAIVSGSMSVGSSTLWGWLNLVDGIPAEHRLPYLAPQRSGGSNEAEIDPGAWQFLLSDYLRPEQPTFTSCYWRMVKDYAAPRGLDVPGERTLRRKLERDVDPRLVIARRKGAEELRRTLPAQQRSVIDLHALEAVNIDGHKFDVFVRWPDGRVGRPTMVAIQDIYSRKILAWRIGESESAIQTRLTFADLFAKWGIPRHCLLDNGRAFASKWITGGATSRFRFKIRDDEPTGILTALGVQIHWATPYRGQSKPIERAFRDLCDTIAKHPALAGAYTGNRPDAKPENYGSRAVPIDTFRAVVESGIGVHNARPNRRTETARGRSFDETFAESYASAPIGKATDEQLRLALLTAEDRPCDRKTSVITLEGNRYWAPELAGHAGKRLTIRFDPDNLHSAIHVYDRAGQFIVTAPVMAPVGFFDKASAGVQRGREAQLRRLVREQAEIEQLIDANALAAMLPDHIDEAPMPRPSVSRMVRHRGQTAAALKQDLNALSEPVQPAVIDRFAAAASRLRVVE